jgi:hypothetical protein
MVEDTGALRLLLESSSIGQREFDVDDAMKHLSKCAHLKTVLLNSNELLTDAAGEHLSKCPELRHLWLLFCTGFTDAFAEHLANCKQLQVVNFGICFSRLSGPRGNWERVAEYLARCPSLKAVGPRCLHDQMRRPTRRRHQGTTDTAMPFELLGCVSSCKYFEDFDILDEKGYVIEDEALRIRR